MVGTHLWWVDKGYFPFEAGNDGYPHLGQVLSHYRTKKTVNGKSLRQYDLAHLLDLSERYIWTLENTEEGWDSFYRRAELITLLDIPPSLFKLDASYIKISQTEHHPGQVVREYRKKKLKEKGKSWSQADLAELLGVSVKSVQSTENHDVGLDSIARREFLINILSIPPMLLGLDALHVTEKDAYKAEKGRIPKSVTINHERISAHLTSLPSYWEAYYAGRTPLKEVEQAIQDLRNMVAYVNSTQQEHIEGLLCRYHQLALDIARDRGDLEQALTHASLAVMLAEKMEDNYLLAASLYRRGLTHFDDGKLIEAASDLTNALPMVKGESRQLRGMVFMEAGRFQAHIAQGSIERLKAEKLLDRTQEIVFNGNFEDDGSYVKLDVGRYSIGRAATLLALDRPSAALEKLDDAARLTAPEHLRRHAYINILRARAYFAQEHYDFSTEIVREALHACLDIRSESNIADIARLYHALTQTSFGNALSVIQLGVKLHMQK